MGAGRYGYGRPAKAVLVMPALTLDEIGAQRMLAYAVAQPMERGAGDIRPYQYFEKGLTVTMRVGLDGRRYLSLARAGRQPTGEEEEHCRRVFGVPAKGVERLVFTSGPNTIVSISWWEVEQPRGWYDQLLLPTEPAAARVWSVLGLQPLHFDEIGMLAEMPAGEVAATTLVMELGGLIAWCGAGRYCRHSEE